MTVLEHLTETFDKTNVFLTRGRVYCNDGFSVSIQGGNPYVYCTPRQHVNEYIRVELGFPSEHDELILPFAENPEDSWLALADVAARTIIRPP